MTSTALKVLNANNEADETEPNFDNEATTVKNRATKKFDLLPKTCHWLRSGGDRKQTKDEDKTKQENSVNNDEEGVKESRSPSHSDNEQGREQTTEGRKDCEKDFEEEFVPHDKSDGKKEEVEEVASSETENKSENASNGEEQKEAGAEEETEAEAETKAEAEAEAEVEAEAEAEAEEEAEEEEKPEKQLVCNQTKDEESSEVVKKEETTVAILQPNEKTKPNREELYQVAQHAVKNEVDIASTNRRVIVTATGRFYHADKNCFNLRSATTAHWTSSPSSHLQRCYRCCDAGPDDSGKSGLSSFNQYRNEPPRIQEKEHSETGRAVAQVRGTRVIVTATGKYYHGDADCSCLSNAKTARWTNYVPSHLAACPWCLGSSHRSSSYTASTQRQSGQLTVTRQVISTSYGGYYHTDEGCYFVKSANMAWLVNSSGHGLAPCKKCVLKLWW